MSGGIIDGLYDGSAAIGRTTSAIAAIIMTIIAIIMIIIAIYLLLNPSVYTKPVTATIISVDSSNPVVDGNEKVTSQYNYSLHVSYEYQSKEYTSILVTTSSNVYKKTDTIQVMLNPKDPNQIEESSSLSRKTIAWVIIGVSTLGLSISWLGYYLTRKSKAYAALTGVSNVVGLFTQH
jgi:predicted permease